VCKNRLFRVFIRLDTVVQSDSSMSSPYPTLRIPSRKNMLRFVAGFAGLLKTISYPRIQPQLRGVIWVVIPSLLGWDSRGARMCERVRIRHGSTPPASDQDHHCDSYKIFHISLLFKTPAVKRGRNYIYARCLRCAGLEINNQEC